MTGIGTKMSKVKEERLRKLTEEGLLTRIIGERLNLHSSQVTYHQRRLGIWEGERRKE